MADKVRDDGSHVTSLSFQVKEESFPGEECTAEIPTWYVYKIVNLKVSIL